jgi:hypothetical protein
MFEVALLFDASESASDAVTLTVLLSEPACRGLTCSAMFAEPFDAIEPS